MLRGTSTLFYISWSLVVNHVRVFTFLGVVHLNVLPAGFAIVCFKLC